MVVCERKHFQDFLLIDHLLQDFDPVFHVGCPVEGQALFTFAHCSFTMNRCHESWNGLTARIFRASVALGVTGGLSRLVRPLGIRLMK
jgi:hypothetical protein